MFYKPMSPQDAIHFCKEQFAKNGGANLYCLSVDKHNAELYWNIPIYSTDDLTDEFAADERVIFVEKWFSAWLNGMVEDHLPAKEFCFLMLAQTTEEERI